MLARRISPSGLAVLVAMVLAIPGWADFLAGKLALQSGDYETAVRELRPAAENRHAEAQMLLGMMYSRGRGVPQNYDEAVKWFRAATRRAHAPAQRGLPEAMHNLGGRYWKGEGVGKDRVYAYAWLDLAAQNLEYSKQSRDALAGEMPADEKKKAEKLSRKWEKNFEIRTR